MQSFASAVALLRGQQPSLPTLCLRPHAAQRAVRWFLANFPGQIVAYALKANDSPVLLNAMYDAGLRHVDVASLPEVEACAHLPEMTLHFMNPVKPREAIRRAYHAFGVRTFSLDSRDELAKILEETDGAKDLTLVVRISVPAGDSLMPLEGKFGVAGQDAVALLQEVRQVADNVGIAFHVGSQTLAPEAYTRAFAEVEKLIIASGVVVDVVDVGGGFPARYTDGVPAPMGKFMEAIKAGFESLTVGPHCQLMCEPGRALVAEAESVILRVEARRGNDLFLNDGAFGVLYDAAHYKVGFPVEMVGAKRGGKMASFSFYGPTCDSADHMPGPWVLPEGIREGDFIEVGMVGAYGRVLANRFNGCGQYHEAVLTDAPMFSLFGTKTAAVEGGRRAGFGLKRLISRKKAG
jgi:ornithine decarboxylase